MAIDKHPDCAQPSRWSWRRCDPQGVVVHDFVCRDDATRDDAGVHRMTLHGVTQAGGKFIPGPLYHFIIDSEGRGYRMAENAAKTNHAGSCDIVAVKRMMSDQRPYRPTEPRGMNPNRKTISVALLRSGQYRPTAAMWDTAARLCASLCADHDWTPNRVVGHRELTTRKIDPNKFDLLEFRNAVRDVMGGFEVDPAVHGSMVADLPTLRPGIESAYVTRAQRRLVDVGLLRDVTGAFDERTVDAVRVYQRCHWLTPDAIIGPDTWAALTKGDTTNED